MTNGDLCKTVVELTETVKQLDGERQRAMATLESEKEEVAALNELRETDKTQEFRRVFTMVQT